MKRLVAVVAVLAVVAAGVPGQAAPGPTLEFLHAANHQVVDSSGRIVILRGVNVNGLVDYWTPSLKPPYPIDAASYDGRCPLDSSVTTAVPLCERDLDQIAALGLDVIRLPLSWSLLEPTKGHLAPVPLARAAQVVGWAKARGIRVVLDLHQDDWSKYVNGTGPCPPGSSAQTQGGDGAPLWASAHVSPACAPGGTGELSPAVQEAAQAFWTSTDLQDHYISVVQELVDRFKDEPAVAGYEIMNEPQPGFLPGAVDPTELMVFQGRVVDTVVTQTKGFKQLFFIEPAGTRNVTASRTFFTPWSTYSSYPNVVYAPHVYTAVFAADALAGEGGHVITSDHDYASAVGDALALGLPLWVGEFGNDPRDDRAVLDPHYEHQDRDKIGGALWVWKEHGAWGAYAPPYDNGGVPRSARLRRMSTAYPLATTGTLYAFHSDPFAGTAYFAGSSPRSAVPTVIVLPPAFTAAVKVTGASFTVSTVRGLRYVQLKPRGGGWTLHVG